MGVALIRRKRHILAVAFSLLLFAVALWVLHRELAGVHLREVLTRLTATEPAALALAVVFTAASYLALIGYDALALRHVGHTLPWRKVALTSFLATAVGHNLGVALLSGGAVRLRMYSAAGLSALEVAGVVAMVGLTFGIGVTCATALALILQPAEVAQLLSLPAFPARAVGATILVLLAAYLGVTATRRHPLRIGGWQLGIPSPSTTLVQIGLAAADLACAGAVLYVLLPAEAAPSYPLFLGVYVLALVAGVLSHLPAAMGVFETVMLLGLPGVPRDALLAAILLYRLVYYLLPLLIAALLAAAHEFQFNYRRIARGLVLAQDALEGMVPQVMAVAVFVVGAVLLFSGATPGLSERLSILQAWLPLPLVELSHLSGSLVGLGLTLLASALHRRVNAGYQLALALLVAGAVFSLLKGLDWEEAGFSAFAALTLWAARGAFYRQASLWQQRFSQGWAVAVALVLAGATWLGLFAYKHVEYAHELWWQFAFDADAPRFLRASLLTLSAATGLALARLLRPAPPPPDLPDAEELHRVASLVEAAPATAAALALVGDKRILFDEGGAGFLMFQIRRRSWIVMGDPVGEPAAIERLAWRFRELCDRYGGRPVFYEVDADHLPLYLDLGLSPLKVGEEALVDLTTFSLDRLPGKGLRQTWHKTSRLGLQLEVVGAGALDDALLHELAAISVAWLRDKHTREKGFSVGRFDPRYLRLCPCALVRRGHQILAFANLWTGAGRAELAVDLMRHAPDAPNGTMDFLFLELMQWGAEQGYRQFNLGMAPLSGLESGPLAPLWHRLGTLMFHHGEHFYNFEGLRAYKEKFHPQWRPKYLAVPPGFVLPTVLLDLSALIAGGGVGIVRP